MKFLAIVKSKHTGNTMQIAEAMSEAAPLSVAEWEDLKYYNISEYDVVGFGGGIYYGKHDKELIEFVKKADNLPKYSFVFSTSGLGTKGRNKRLIKALESRGVKVLGDFACKGNKKHPDGADFDSAQTFIQQIMNDFENQK